MLLTANHDAYDYDKVKALSATSDIIVPIKTGEKQRCWQ